MYSSLLLYSQLAKDLEAVGGDKTKLRVQETNKQLTMYHLQGVFMVFGVGLVMAMLMFIAEYGCGYTKKNNKDFTLNTIIE